MSGADAYSRIPTAHAHQVPRESLRSRRMRALGLVGAGTLVMQGGGSREGGSRMSAEEEQSSSFRVKSSPLGQGVSSAGGIDPLGSINFGSAPKSRSRAWQVVDNQGKKMSSSFIKRGRNHHHHHHHHHPAPPPHLVLPLLHAPSVPLGWETTCCREEKHFPKHPPTPTSSTQNPKPWNPGTKTPEPVFQTTEHP
jgi:hypothetical protein